MFIRTLNYYYYCNYEIIWRMIIATTMYRSLFFSHISVTCGVLKRLFTTIILAIACDRYLYMYKQQTKLKQQEQSDHQHYRHHYRQEQQKQLQEQQQQQRQQQQQTCYYYCYNCNCYYCCYYWAQKTKTEREISSTLSSSLPLHDTSSFSAFVQTHTSCYGSSLQFIYRNLILSRWCVVLFMLTLINPITSAVIGTNTTSSLSSSASLLTSSITSSSQSTLTSLSSSSVSQELQTPIAAALAAPAISSSILEQFTPNCSAVIYLLQSRGFDATEIPQRPNNEMGLRYCESQMIGTCCTHNMETKMAMQSRLQLEKHSRESITKMSHMLSAKMQKYNEIFDNLLKDSKADFNLMFTRTYGVIYQQNSYVFGDLFKEFEAYYKHGNVDLINVMDKFFNILYQKMFTVLNAQYYFDDKYLRCVGEHMKELKPFGDVPDKLSVQIKRSFVATRTYGQALAIAAEASKKLITIRLNPDCTTALTKMQHCGSCKGYVEKPCTNYCINVIKGCLNYLNEFDIEWENFVQAMDKLAERLLGSFNIVMVVEPINIKISEAIMNFQDTGHDITNRVFQGCGRPSLSRPKRTFINIQETLNTNSDLVNASISTSSTTYQMDTTLTIPAAVTIEKQKTADVDILDIDATLDDDTIVLKEKRSADPGPIRDSNGRNKENIGSSGGISSGSGSGSGDGDNRRTNKKNRKNKKDDFSGGRGDPELDKSIRDIRQRVKDLKKFWLNLPQQYCTNDEISTTADTDGMCWNGQTIDRYMHSITTEYGTNPEFPGNPTKEKQTAMVHTQVYHLRNAVTQLRNAYNGQDVIWREQESESYFGSGSGSGTDNDDEDYDGEGSGLSPMQPTYKPQQTDRPSIHLNKNNIDDDYTDILHGDNSGILTRTTRPHNVHDTNRIDDNNDNRIDTSENNAADLRGSGTSTPKMSLRRALFLYLMPLYMAWFGGIISEVL